MLAQGQHHGGQEAGGEADQGEVQGAHALQVAGRQGWVIHLLQYCPHLAAPPTSLPTVLQSPPTLTRKAASPPLTPRLWAKVGRWV